MRMRVVVGKCYSPQGPPHARISRRSRTGVLRVEYFTLIIPTQVESCHGVWFAYMQVHLRVQGDPGGGFKYDAKKICDMGAIYPAIVSVFPPTETMATRGRYPI